MSSNSAVRVRRSWATLALALALVVWLRLPVTALAHAKLTKSSPSAGTILDSSPGKVELSFSEPVSLQFSTIKLLDRTRKELPVGAPTADGSDGVSATLPATLPQGTYTIVWRVLSANDGHVTSGNFAFKVRGSTSSAGGVNNTGNTGGTQEATPEPDEVAPASPVEGSSESPDPLRWLVRALLLASAALLAGGSIFSALIVRPTAAEEGAKAELLPVLRRMFGRLGLVASTVLIISLLLDLVLQIGSIAGGGLGEGFANMGLAGTLLTTTGYGYAWIVKVVAAACLLAAMLVVGRGSAVARVRGTTAWALAGIAGLVLAFGEALSSHAAAAAGNDANAASNGVARLSGGFLPLPILSDWAHLATAFTWIGGVGYIALVLYPGFRKLGMSGDEQRAFLARAIPRFSRLAVAGVVLLAVTGTYNLLVHSTDLGAILGSAYGQVLAVKVGLFIFLVALGAVNLLKLTPQLIGGRAVEGTTNTTAAIPNGTKGLRRSVRIEVALACGAFLCAAGLSLLPPPTGASGAYVAAQASPTIPAGAATTATNATQVAEATATEPPPLTASSSVSVGGYKVDLNVSTALEGDQFTATLTLEDPAAVPLTDVQKVIFKITPQDVDGGSTSLAASQAGDAGKDGQKWTAGETVLTLDGGYLVTVIAQRTQTQDIKAAFRLDLSENAGLKATPSQVLEISLDTDPSPPISGTATLLLSLVDGAGKPVSDADISVSPLMPAHGHVEPTDVAKPVPGKPGAYTMPVHFTMGGSWLIIFDVDRPGQTTIKVDASLDVIDPNATPTPGT